MNVLIVGAGGYIGSVLGPYLHEKGMNVYGIDYGLYYYDGVDQCVMKDKTDFRSYTIPKGTDAVVHLAALSNDPLGALNESVTRKLNAQDAYTFALHAKTQGVKRFVFMSSCSVYGFSDKIVYEQDAVNPLTAYSKSKLEAESLILPLCDYTFWPTALRCATACGASPMFRNDLVLNRLVSDGVTTGNINLDNDGSIFRPLIHVKDIAEAIYCVLTAPQSSIMGEYFNIGNQANTIKIVDLANKVKSYLPNALINVNKTNIDNRSYKPSFSKFRRYTNFETKFGIEECIEDVINYVSSNNLNKYALESSRYIRLERLKDLFHTGELTKDVYWAK